MLAEAVLDVPPGRREDLDLTAAGVIPGGADARQYVDELRLSAETPFSGRSRIGGRRGPHARHSEHFRCGARPNGAAGRIAVEEKS